MPIPSVSGTVTDQNLQDIKTALATIEAALPLLKVALTEDDRKSARKTGEGRLPFVLDAGEIAQDNPDILPKTFDTAGFESTVALFTALTEVVTLIDQTRAKADDTRLAAGVQALSGASDVYHYAQNAVKKTPGIKPIVDRMGQQFQQAAATRHANAQAKLAKAAAK
jgi:hypothetical protein